MACKRMATCRARFARGEQACVRCAEGKLDVGDVEDLDDEEDNLDEGEIDDDDDDDDEFDELEDGEEHDDDEEYAYTTQPDGEFGDLAGDIEIGGETVRGLRVTVIEPNLEDVDYVIVALDARDNLPADVRDFDVDYYAENGEMLYDDILAAFVDYNICNIKQR